MFNKTKKYLSLITLSLSVLLFVSSFLSSLKTDDNEIIMTGIKAIFGGQVGAFGSFFSADVKFCFLNLIAFFLPAILTIALAIYSLLDKEASLPKKILEIAIMISFVLSIVLIAFLPNNTKGSFTFLGDETIFSYKGAKLAIGAILGLVFSVLGLLVSAYQNISQSLTKLS